MEKIANLMEIKAAEAALIKAGLSEIELMQRAANGVFNAVDFNKKIAIFCGGGNNGGDGYALANILVEKGFSVKIFALSQKRTKACDYYYSLCKNKKIEILFTSENSVDIKEFDYIVDCMTGTGVKGELKGDYAKCSKLVNDRADYQKVIAVDVPSGLNANNGSSTNGVKADITVTIGALKPGLYLSDAKDVVGEIRFVDIGLKIEKYAVNRLIEADFIGCLPKRKENCHKGQFGTAAVLGGSCYYPGAAKLAYSALSALVCGCGISRIIAPKFLAPEIFSSITEQTYFPLPCDEEGAIFENKALDLAIKNLTSLAVGMGMLDRTQTGQIISHILKNAELNLIIDADGLNALAKLDKSILTNTKCRVVLTPHIKEFSRLLGKSVAEVLDDPISLAKEFANKFGVIVLLKGAASIVTDGNEIVLIDKGTAGMATAGSGDVLSGILAGLLAYLPFNIKTVALGCYINGAAGEAVNEQICSVCHTASDTISKIKQTVTNLYNNKMLQ